MAQEEFDQNVPLLPDDVDIEPDPERETINMYDPENAEGGNPSVWYVDGDIPSNLVTKEEYDQLYPPPVAPEPTVQEMRNEAIEAVKRHSWLVETGGIVVNEMTILTDEGSQQKINGAVTAAMANPDLQTEWQTDTLDYSGIPVFIYLSAAQITAIGLAVRNHIQACFDMRKQKFDELRNLQSVQAIRDWLETSMKTGWPPTALPVSDDSSYE